MNRPLSRVVHSTELRVGDECLRVDVRSFDDEHPDWDGGELTYTVMLFDERGDALDSADCGDEDDAIRQARTMILAEVERRMEMGP